MTDEKAIKRTLDSFIGLLKPAIAKDAKIAVLIDFGNLRVASYLNCGDCPKEKAQFLEKFSRHRNNHSHRITRVQGCDMTIKRTLDSFIGLLEPAIAKDAKIAVLIDFGNLILASYLNCGDHAKEKARFLEKFSREERKSV